MNTTIKVIIISAMLMATAVIADAQNDFYQKYSGKEGVTKVYISKTMLSLFGEAEGLDVNLGSKGDKIDIAKLAKNLDGLYILTSENKSLVKEMEADFIKMLKDYKLELLMEVADDGDNVKMYVAKEGTTVTNFFMHSLDSGGELAIIYFGGRIPEEDIINVMKSAN